MTREEEARAYAIELAHPGTHCGAPRECDRCRKANICECTHWSIGANHYCNDCMAVIERKRKRDEQRQADKHYAKVARTWYAWIDGAA